MDYLFRLLGTSAFDNINVSIVKILTIQNILMILNILSILSILSIIGILSIHVAIMKVENKCSHYFYVKNIFATSFLIPFII